MKKGLIVLLIILLVIIVIAGWFISRYNKIQKEKISVETAWAQVENVYQSRFDLIPNLVATVQGAANFEKETLTEVTEARSKMGGQVNLPPEALSDPAAFQQFQANQAGLSSALSRLMVVVEKYPDLKANQNFLQFQAQLEGIENRLRNERMNFNDAAKEYNQLIVIFPNNKIAGMIGAKAFQFFAAETQAQTAPNVGFN
ncbi:MAG: LemA family protein [Candidatus Cloacimonetes bacterium]|jgi:LemA protein|nr:LemA family protein [Candidatus Cloacimonadota bacterium]MCB5287452.1 LemA family protein [Candidatus Cloacimonadota bacterium]MCK9185069.1 LemA family protein [Candidatus Cloacimonadota bacterium]MCK9584986.1 LemA family protein [Candidatus Cloacimonadota bacterium]MDY0229773.1 LemA family protein [Candidatus Cloacimonadaceae bacterium]